jgi:hypothetical protein
MNSLVPGYYARGALAHVQSDEEEVGRPTFISPSRCALYVDMSALPFGEHFASRYLASPLSSLSPISRTRLHSALNILTEYSPFFLFLLGPHGAA